MATKTLTITEEAYNLLKVRKQKGESFSEEIKRLFGRGEKKPLQDFFGILSDNTGSSMLKDIEKIKKDEIKILKKRLK